ncbi:hypothetical protein Poli38472_002470 [Pythium oligandrum]|uniref:WD repeat and coiled-coil-containing protein n=1 Tax=Pythium oligandrum TaxID=41045 RepID=A0A8K1CI74_PYTOL|nr:hypothetical protein Poli38472_002470 [Pythium oligandrum]|eukprot:TMW63529.1 hypothetical protein Poli38472_002470 [Pythium oligandrum]
MMVDGPVEWTEAEGSRLDVLQQAYNVRLKIVALPKGSTVLLTRFDDGNDGEPRLVGDDIATQKIDELPLHSDDVAWRSYLHVAWSAHSDQKQWLAIASSSHVEVWEVSIADSAIQASLKGSAKMDRIRTLCWNPRLPVVMMNSDTKNVLIEVTHERIIEIELALVSRPSSQIVKRCAWSPCGLTLARAFKKDIEFYSWSKLEDILRERPIHSDFRVDQGAEARFLDAEPSRIGPIASISQLSASVCLLTTELTLSLDEPASMGLSAPTTSSIELPKANAHDTSSNVIDLTSLRITTSSRSSLLSILDNRPDPSPVLTKVQTPPQSARVILVVKDTNGQWRQASNIEIPKLTLPDRLRVEGMRVVIGSTLSNVLLVAHLDHDTRSAWSLAISGELELSNGYTCRGIHLAQTSPFVQVATTEKAKRTFFSASPGSQRIHLSKLKLPRRPTKERYPPVAPPTATPTASQHTANSIGLEDVLNRLAALQTQMISRFDRIDEQLASMCSRLDHLEATQSSK